MHAVAIVLAASALTVDYGWEKTGDGQLEYIIQIEPPLLEVLRAGGTITSEIDPQVAQVRRFRVRVGRDPVPRELPSTTIDAARARPIETPNEPAGMALDPLTLEPSSNDETMQPSPPAWSAAAGAETGKTEPRDVPSLDLAPDLVNRTDQAIQQPDQARMLEAPFDLEPSNHPRPLHSDADVAAAADRQFSPLRPWDDETSGANDASRQVDNTDRFGTEASRVDVGSDVPPVATPAEHDDPFGGRREEPTVYDPSVQNAAVGEDLYRRSDEQDLRDGTEAPLAVADANPTQETFVTPGLTNSPKSETTQSDPAPTITPRRWLPFLLTLLALFASCGLNFYLGWITWDTYCRYQRLVATMHRTKAPSGTT